MTLVVANKGPTAVQLEADSPLGGVVPVEEVQSDKSKTSGKEEVSEPELCKDHGRVCVIQSDTGRRQELLGQLDMKIRMSLPSRRMSWGLPHSPNTPSTLGTRHPSGSLQDECHSLSVTKLTSWYRRCEPKE